MRQDSGLGKDPMPEDGGDMGGEDTNAALTRLQPPPTSSYRAKPCPSTKLRESWSGKLAVEKVRKECPAASHSS